VAIAAGGHTYSQKFTTVHPKTASGMTFSAAQTAAVPVQAKTVTLAFPAGTEIDRGALAKCPNRPPLRRRRRSGRGKATVGLAVDVAAYNCAGAMALVVTNPLGPAVLLTPKQGHEADASDPVADVPGPDLRAVQADPEHQAGERGEATIYPDPRVLPGRQLEVQRRVHVRGQDECDAHVRLALQEALTSDPAQTLDRLHHSGRSEAPGPHDLRGLPITVS
jgi:hypothetical protein